MTGKPYLVRLGKVCRTNRELCADYIENAVNFLVACVIVRIWAEEPALVTENPGPPYFGAGFPKTGLAA